MEQTLEQRNNAYRDAGVTPPVVPTAITADSLKPVMPIQLPPPPQDTANYSGMVAGGNAAINSNNTYMTPSGAKVDAQGNVISTPDTASPDITTPPNWYQKILDQLKPTKPVSAADTYTTLYGTSNIDSLTADKNAKALATKNAQSKLAGINAQLAGLNAESQAVPIANQERFKGTGATRGETAVDTVGQQRVIALRALPLQAQAIAAQAEVASAQGDEQLSASLLTQAQDHLDKVFQIHMADATSQYNYQKDLYDSVLAQADKEETRQITAKKDALTLNQSNLSDARNFAQTLSATALTNGQAGLASKLASLQPPDVNSKNFAQELQKYNEGVASIQSQIAPKQDTQIVEINGKKVLMDKQGNIIKQLETGGGNDTSGLTPEQQKDPFITKLLNSKGGKALTDTSIQSLTKGINVLGQLGALQANIKDTSTGPISGLFRGINPWDTNAQTIKAQLNAVVPNLARGIYGEVGVLTDNDIKQYSKTLPNLSSTEDVRNAVLGITLDMIGKSIKSTLEVNAASGRDVSGFVDLYTEMQKTRDSIFSQIPGYKGAGTQSLQSLGVTKDEENVFDNIVGSPSSISTGGNFFGNFLKGLGF